MDSASVSDVLVRLAELRVLNRKDTETDPTAHVTDAAFANSEAFARALFSRAPDFPAPMVFASDGFVSFEWIGATVFIDHESYRSGAGRTGLDEAVAYLVANAANISPRSRNPVSADTK
jgi:hypothetical protein